MACGHLKGGDAVVDMEMGAHRAREGWCNAWGVLRCSIELCRFDERSFEWSCWE